MKTFYTLILAISCCGIINAQVKNPHSTSLFKNTPEKYKNSLKQLKTSPNQPGYKMAAPPKTTATVVYSEDFAGGLPVGWSVANTAGGLDWFYTATGGNAALYGLELLSTTASNGWMMFDSDAGGGVGGEDATLTSPSIDLTGTQNVRLRFESQYCFYASSITTLTVSNGITDTTFTINDGSVNEAIQTQNNCSSANPDLITIDITNWASNQANVTLEFRWQGDYDYWWQIDDIVIEEIPDTEVVMLDGYYTPAYAQVPFSQRPVYYFSADIFNDGANDFTGASVDLDIAGGLMTDNVSSGTVIPDNGETEDFSTPFTPCFFGLYENIYNVTLSGDADITNNADTSYIIVNDSVMAREYGADDFGNLIGGLEYSQKIEVFEPETLTSISCEMWLWSENVGQVINFALYSSSADTPLTQIAATINHTIVNADTVQMELTLPFSGGGIFLNPGTYFLYYSEPGTSQFGTMLAATYSWEQNSAYVKNTTTWVPVEAIGSNFFYSFTMRANFGGMTGAELTADSADVVNPLCNGDATGSATLYHSGGVSPFTYLWDDPQSQTTATATGLSADTFTVIVTDAYGCTAGGLIALSEPPALVIDSVLLTDLLCGGDSSGSATVYASGGTSPLSYNWSNGDSDSSIANVSGGNYSVTVSDVNGCSDSITITINEPTPLLSNFNFKNISCAGVDDGMAWVNPSGGTTPYSVNWVLGQTTDTITGLTPGNTGVMVTDNNGCFTYDSVTITEPAALVIDSIQFSDVSCNGGNDGFAAVYALGGTSPYTYNWSNGATSSSVFGLPSSVYYITVTDANGCTDNSSIIISEPAQLIIDSILLVSPQCSGDTSGMASVYVSGGVSPYFFNWSNGANGPGNSVQGPLSAGTYSVSITDANNCSVDSIFTISQPNLLTATLSHTDETLPAANDGTATANPTGGTGGYNYNWSNSGTTQTISNLSPGNYIVTITDANNCEFIDSVFVNAGGCNLVIDSTAQTNVSCFGGNSGSATVFVSSGSGNYTYSWSNGQTAQTAIGLMAQSYSVVITDVLIPGCQKNTTVNILQPFAPVNDTIQVSGALCNAGTGSATSTPSGGVSPYTYNWSTGGTGATENNIPSGNYNVTITDANGCSAVKSFTITQPASPLTATVTVTNESCVGCNDGEITISASGGTTPYSYLWDANTGGQTTATSTGLSPGNFCFTVTDANGCTYSDCATVLAYVCNMTISVSGMDVSSCAGNDGMAMSSASNGTSPYTYDWSNGGTTQDISNLSSGTYIVTITDDNGCMEVDSTVVVDGDFSVSIDSIVVTSDITCNGDCNGEAMVYASGGFSPPYSYSWSNGGTNDIAPGLCSGTNSVTVTDPVEGCSAIDSVSLAEPTVLSVTVSATDESSAGANDGDATANPSGGTSPYSYNWDNSETTPTITGLTAGTYYVTITDDNGCMVQDSAVVNTAPIVICLSSTPYGNTDAPTNDITTTIDACNYAGEFATVDLISSGETYEFSTSVSTDWLVLTATNDSVLIQGTNPISWTATFSGTVYLHIFADSACGTQSTCRISSVQCLSCPAGSPPSCVGTFPYGNQTAPENNVQTLIDSCNWAGDYATVTSVDSSQTYQFSSSTNTDWLTLTDASNNLLAEGTSPISWIASFNGNVRLHIHTDSLCGQEDSCRVTNVQCMSCCLGFTASATSTNETSPGANDGTANVSASGGTAQYTYNWNNGGNTQTISNLPPGFYNAMVTDSAGCTAQSNTVSVNAAGCNMTATATVTNSLLCNGDSNGTATATASNGTAPFIFQWSNGDSTATAGNLSAGTYTVSMMDASNCLASASVTLTEPPVISAVVSTTNPLCNGGTGTATFTSSGGTGTLSFNWSNGGTGTSQTNLSAGNYSVTVSDNNSCSIIILFTITEPAMLLVSVSATSETSAGADDGTATANASGGTTNYSYIWNSGATTSSLNSLSPATYSVTVTDANGCTANASGIVNPFGCNISISGTSTTDVSCSSGDDGTATVSISGGTTPVTYNWSNGDNTATADSLSAGNYSVTVTDAGGCGAIAGVNISQPTLLSVNVSATGETSFGANDGTASAVGSGGTAPYNYSWNTGDTTATISGLAPGNYCVTITDGNGCTTTACDSVNDFVCTMTVSVSATDETAAGANDGTAAATVTGGTTPYGWMWSNGESNIGSSNGDTIFGCLPGIYCVTVTDANNCTAIGCDSVAPGPNSVNEISNEISFAVHPNPNNGKFVISHRSLVISKIKIYNVLGEVVYSSSIFHLPSSVSVDLSKEGSGIYFVKVETEKGIKVEKIIVE